MNAMPPLPSKLKEMPRKEKASAMSLLSALADTEQKKYVLESANIFNSDMLISVDDTSEGEDLEFSEIPVEQFEESSESELEETLEQAVRNIHDKQIKTKQKKKENIVLPLIKNPEVVDDFIRNFLSQRGMTKTLDSFQARLVLIVE
jgi:hypothetical protein